MKTNRQLMAVPLILALACLGLSGCNRDRSVQAAREDRPPAVSTGEQNFMKKATEANLTEIDVARIALQKSDNTDVRDYATMIQSDHMRALEDLTDLMTDKGVPEPKTLAADIRKDVDRM